MGYKLTTLVDRIRVEKGPFFVARLNLRLQFPRSFEDLPDTEEYEQELIEACIGMGYDPR